MLRESFVLLRICEKTKSLTTTGYAELSGRLIEIGKILGGWIKNAKTGQLPSTITRSLQENPRLRFEFEFLASIQPKYGPRESQRPELPRFAFTGFWYALSVHAIYVLK
jgi:hypothetical protein